MPRPRADLSAASTLYGGDHSPVLWALACDSNLDVPADWLSPILCLSLAAREAGKASNSLVCFQNESF